MSPSSRSSRFESPSSSLDLGSLLKGLRRAFWISLALAAGIHLLAVTIDPLEESSKKAPRPMMTKFVKREPRLTKPLELRKVPKPKRQMIRREVQLAAARVDQIQATSAFNTSTVIGGLGGVGSGPAISTGASIDFGTVAAEPGFGLGDLATTRKSEDRVDMALEMLDVNAMDTGRYRAMLVTDPTDKQAIKGFINFASTISGSALARGSAGHAARGNAGRTLDLLRDSLNEFTGIKADFKGLITYDDERLMEIPFIIPQGTPSESEMENLAEYLKAGGFVYGGVWNEALEKYGGLVRGQDFWSERLPEDHPIFTAFFDLQGGVPSGYTGSLGSGKSGVASWNYVIGHFVEGRLAGISFPSGGTGLGATVAGRDGDTTRQIQMAINVVVYALTQEGGMTQRLMQMVN